MGGPEIPAPLVHVPHPIPSMPTLTRSPSLSRPVLSVLTSLLFLLLASGLHASEARPRYRSPFAIREIPGTGHCVVTDTTHGSLVKLDLESGKVLGEVRLQGQPRGLTLDRAGRRAFVAESLAWTVAEVDLESLEVLRRFEVGRRPLDVALTPDEKNLLVSGSTGHDLWLVDLDAGKVSSRLELPREPFFLEPIPGTSDFLVGNLLPVGAPGTPTLRTLVSRVGLDARGKLVVRGHLELPVGSTSVRQIRAEPGGAFAWVVHTVGRIHVPATQLERGWISTNALSLLDLEKGKVAATVLLDSPQQGASDPWGVELSDEARTLLISLRGTHEVARVDLAGLRRALERGVPVGDSGTPLPESPDGRPGAYDSRDGLEIWWRIASDPIHVRDLVHDLRALGALGLIERYPAGVRGPLDLRWSEDREELLVVGRFSGTVARLSSSGELLGTLAVGEQPPADLVRRGEELFHDATISFQNWLSCSTCHPDDGRNDGLRWDLPNDGLGTPQMTRSLIRSHLVAPTTARGVRAGFRVSSTAGFLFLGTQPTETRVAEVMAYLEGQAPEPSPFLARDGKLTPAQSRGKELFEGDAGCTKCHQGEIRTDLKPHRIGTARKDEVGGNRFYTPKLLELYRTAPFLHDGRAATLRDIFTVHNEAGKHGEAADLTADELEDLLAYLMTL